MKSRSRNWLREHVSDPYVKRARSEDYRSRAAYKLLEIHAREHLFSPGQTVLDLGAAPGGWSQVVALKVAPNGRVIALDVLEMPPLRGVELLRCDVRAAKTHDLLAATLTEGAHIVISDMAPNISGVSVHDQAAGLELCEMALEFALRYLKPHGTLLVKAFHGQSYEAFVTQMSRHFDSVVVRKPRASRDRSSEVYLLGRGRKSA
ncbi:MAG: RlmE family RNA methyltransferase [Burkholderiales bacterium]